MAPRPDSQNQEKKKKGGKNGEKRKTRKEVATSGSHNASIGGSLRTGCPRRQDVKMQKRATLARPGEFRRGLTHRERCLVGREGNPHRKSKHHGRLIVCWRVLAWLPSPATDL